MHLNFKTLGMEMMPFPHVFTLRLTKPLGQEGNMELVVE